MPDIYQRGRIWWADYTDAGSGLRVRCTTRMTNKAAAQAVLARLIRDSERRAAGLSAVDPALARLDLADHLAAWSQSLSGGGCTRAHITKARRGLDRLIQSRGWRRLPDLSAGAIDAALSDYRAGVSAKTANNLRGHLGSFLAFCERTGRIEGNPMRTPMFSGDAIVRRALSAGEVRTLLGCLDIDRSRRELYAFAVLTGLRASELRGLRVSHCRLGPGAHLDMPPELTKSGKRESIPLAGPAVLMLARLTVGQLPTSRVFRIPSESFTSRRFLKDLALCGIKAEDERGHVAVFHSLRKTHNSLLAAAGVSGTVRMQLMRQRSVDLAEKTYLDPRLLPLVQAVESVAPLIGNGLALAS